MLCCVVFHKSEFNRVSAQELFLIWCIHNRKQVYWAYWIFNQFLQCASRKDILLTHGHIITIIAKAFNVDFAQVDHVAPCTYFTKQALVRGEVVNASFRVVPAHTRSYWKGIPHPHFVGQQHDEEHAKVGHVQEDVQGEDQGKGDATRQEEWPQDDPPIPPFTTQGSASGSSSHEMPIWEQVLGNQHAMQHQLTALETSNRQLYHRQRQMEYKMQ